MDEQAANYVIAALERLGAAKVQVPGARVAKAAVDLARADDYDFNRALKTTREKFGDLVRGLQNVGRVSVSERVGSDLLLGLPGAGAPPTAGSEQIRSDFYKAFSHVRDRALRYVTESDRIDGEGVSGIEIPPVPSAELWGLRQAFVDQLDPGAAKDALLPVLEDENRTFRTFSDAASRAGATEDWRRFQHDALQRKIIDWARTHGIAIKEDWFSARKQERDRVRREPSSLSSILSLLTPEELSRVLVPADLIVTALQRLRQ